MPQLTRCMVLGATLALAACAHTPSVTMRYAYARADLDLKVTRTVACDGANVPIVANTVAPTVKHSADRSVPMATISVAGLRGPMVDSDLKFEFQEDGRLKAINTTTTGQGETVLKAAFTFFGAILGVDGGSTPQPTLCATIKTWNDKKPVTLVYEGRISPTKELGPTLHLTPDPASASYADELASVIGPVCASVTAIEPAQLPIEYTEQKGDVLLPMRQPGYAHVQVRAGTGENCGEEIWSGLIPAGQLGADYPLPIPRATVFGKQSFAVAVNESGSLGSLQYAHTSGAASTFNTAAAGLDLVDGQTAAQKAAALKSEADLIAAQQRLVACRANWEGCK